MKWLYFKAESGHRFYFRFDGDRLTGLELAETIDHWIEEFGLTHEVADTVMTAHNSLRKANEYHYDLAVLLRERG